MKVRGTWAVGVAGILLGCGKGAPKDAPAPASAAAPTEAAEEAPASAAPSESVAAPEPTDDPSLRRAYGPDDLKFHPCVKVADDGTVRGEHCPAAFVVFGPYVGAPPKSTLHVAFKMHVVNKLFVTSDVVSANGQQFHGSMDEQAFNAGETRKLGYRIRLPLPATAVEARIGIRADTPVDFTITDLSVAVE